jgi:hypothetical protein
MPQLKMNQQQCRSISPLHYPTNCFSTEVPVSISRTSELGADTEITRFATTLATTDTPSNDNKQRNANSDFWPDFWSRLEELDSAENQYSSFSWFNGK